MTQRPKFFRDPQRHPKFGKISLGFVALNKLKDAEVMAMDVSENEVLT